MRLLWCRVKGSGERRGSAIAREPPTMAQKEAEEEIFIKYEPDVEGMGSQEARDHGEIKYKPFLPVFVVATGEEMEDDDQEDVPEEASWHRQRPLQEDAEQTRVLQDENAG